MEIAKKCFVLQKSSQYLFSESDQGALFQLRMSSQKINLSDFLEKYSVCFVENLGCSF